MRSILYPVEWGLSPSEQKVMGVLLTREMATKDALMAALYTANGRDEAELKIVDVFICKMRKKLKPFAISITTVWAQGYALPPDIRRTLRAKLLEKPAA
ncbi:helix-turn-helix domain-containing protein [uncultured Alsobacter sp.]|uniref:helix-turn-helix domain-containing protein n=1 Tax=uncultured Alsobacter sp. TaxID=1748258 RepID=UPI00345C6AD8